MATPRVLLFGGTGGVARHMTSLMLSRAWDVVSVIRDQTQIDSILQLGEGHKGRIDVVISNLEDFKSVEDATAILDKAKANIVVFAAGSMSNPFAVDRDALKMVIKASVDTPSITKFLLISVPASRRGRAPWWTDTDYQNFISERDSYPSIQQAKLEGDEYLVAMANARVSRGGSRFQAICLRPTWMSNNKGMGTVSLGKTAELGNVAREDVAAVAVTLLSRTDTQGWFDMVEGSVGIEEAVDAVVRTGVNCIEGEDVNRIYKLAD